MNIIKSTLEKIQTRKEIKKLQKEEEQLKNITQELKKSISSWKIHLAEVLKDGADEAEIVQEKVHSLHKELQEVHSNIKNIQQQLDKLQENIK